LLLPDQFGILWMSSSQDGETWSLFLLVPGIETLAIPWSPVLASTGDQLVLVLPGVTVGNANATLYTYRSTDGAIWY
jgi:hypothetical protein